MGFIFSPESKARAQDRLQAIMRATKQQMEDSVPFAMNPVVYDFQINEHGTVAQLLTDHASLMPARYYALLVPGCYAWTSASCPPPAAQELDRLGAASRINPRYSGIVQDLFDRLLPSTPIPLSQQTKSLARATQKYGFDPWNTNASKQVCKVVAWPRPESLTSRRQD